ncbi:MAG TPA: hypothetical protein VNM47_18610 [Terriglobia bacterium]|nr:hypothetical protein [Terriglobia bacterium]
MEQDNPLKMMTEAEFQAVIRRYRIEHLELIEPSLRVLENHGKQMRGARGHQYRRQLAKARIVATEVQNVMEAYRGQVGKTISPEAFEALIDDARRRGHRKARMAPDRCESK